MMLKMTFMALYIASEPFSKNYSTPWPCSVPTQKYFFLKKIQDIIKKMLDCFPVDSPWEAFPFWGVDGKMGRKGGAGGGEGVGTKIAMQLQF